MRRRGGLAALLGMLGATAAQAGGVPVTAIRFGHDGGQVRMVLDLAAPVPFTWDAAADGRRLTLTLVGIEWRPPKARALPGEGDLTAYRFEPAIGGAGQVQLEAAKPLRVRSVRELPPEPGVPLHRIVVDLAAAPPVSEADSKAAALLERGVRLVLGSDGAVDFAGAADAFLQAAAAGSPQAAFNLGELYRAGRGVPQDYRQAADWFRRAAEARFAPARFHLAVLAFNGVGVPRDREGARMLIEQAAAQGLPQARRALADLESAGGPVRLSQESPSP